MAAHTPEYWYDVLGDFITKGDRTLLLHGPRALIKMAELDFLDQFRVEVPVHSYRRPKVMGEEGKHVLRLMQFNSVDVPYHEHHGRPCLMAVIDGTVVVENAWMEQQGNGLYRIRETVTRTLTPGMADAVNPLETEIHRIQCAGRATALHLYPADHAFAFVYEPAAGLYVRTRRELQ